MNSPMAAGELIQDISPNDTMFEGNRDYYFEVGRSAVRGIMTALQTVGRTPGQIGRVLDLPCGHGRVLRHLKHAFPRASFVASDLDTDGVDYCAATFGATPVYSQDDPTQLPLEPGTFDLIWVGSLLTHFDDFRWPVFLGFFRACLRLGGVLVFTTHGRRAHYRLASGEGDYSLPTFSRAAVLQAHDRTGFGYVNYPHQDKYGFSLSRAGWVMDEVARVDDLRVVHYAEKGWVDHQDLVAVVRQPGWMKLVPDAELAPGAGTANGAS